MDSVFFRHALLLFISRNEAAALRQSHENQGKPSYRFKVVHGKQLTDRFADVRVGSNWHARFTPKSGILQCTSACPPKARSDGPVTLTR